ncbi:hypothetical protein HOD96_00270 [Candidatus Falkowbacteria bacterium]|jgi:predicted transcriptional regulator of viral defense system|nr:hypothetical protein [Candidatus Falkowbacteria bacterium]MBT4432846.1 hypothetical protein [Candidatus Falkowbacteria bacterium]
MKYIDFYQHFKDYPIIQLADVKNIESDFDHRRLYEWQKKGYLKRVTNNFYIFADKKLSDFEMNFVANKLYQPSYLSLEYALGFYSLIPEIVFLHTCITTKKTKQITSSIGNFSYRSIKKELFFGYKLVQKDNMFLKIADPEKALLDFLYLRSDIKNKNDVYELRINKDVFKEIINHEKINNYLKKFNSKQLIKKIKIVNNYVKS